MRSSQEVGPLSDRVILALALATVIGAIIVGQFHLVPTQPLCWSVLLFGKECPGCGLTRSFAALGRGELAAANSLNPLGPILFGYALLLIAIRLVKPLTPHFRYWAEVDLGAATAVVLCLVTRTILFYFF